MYTYSATFVLCARRIKTDHSRFALLYLIASGLVPHMVLRLELSLTFRCMYIYRVFSQCIH